MPSTESSEVLRPCDPASADYREAKRRFEEIDRDVQKLAPDADPEPIVAKLVALAQSPCFAIGGGIDLPERKTDGDGRPDSGYSLKAFWRDGGKDWIDGYLDLGDPDASHVLWTRPTFPRTLSKETTSHSALAPLLCSVRDDACVHTTVAFRERLRHRSAVFLAAKQLGRQLDGTRPFVDLVGCLNQPSASTQLTTWVRCFEDYAEREPTVPLPGIRRPTRGWLYVSDDQRGVGLDPSADRTCIEERAYDLATGAAFKARVCRGKGPQFETERGSVPAIALSEAVWFLLQKDALDLQVRSVGIELSRDVDLTCRSDALGGGSGWELCGECSDCEDRDWMYELDGVVVGRGTTSTNPFFNCIDEQLEADSYAAELLAVAEQLFTPGCPPTAPPRVSPGRHSGYGRDRDRMLDAAWKQRALRGVCKGEPPRSAR
jgi:hypothetical protein